VPALPKKLPQGSFTDLAGAQKAGDQDFLAHLHLAQDEFIGQSRIVLATHPVRPCLGLWPTHPVVTLPELLTTSKVGVPRAVLGKQHIHAHRLQGGDEEVIAIKRVGQHHIPGREDRGQPAPQTQLARALTSMGPHRRIQQRPRRQADHSDQARQRRAHTGTLARGLRIARLVRGGVGHQNAGAIDQFHAPTPPAPTRLCALAQQHASVASQGADHLQRQSLASLAVGSGIDAVDTQAFHRTLRSPAIHRLLTRPILAQDLSHEHRQRQRWRIQPFTMFRQQRLGHLQQFWRGEQVEEIHRRDRTGVVGDASGVLLGDKARITITQGWPSRWEKMLCGNNILLLSEVSLLFNFQYISRAFKSRVGLSQCHSA
jgi:hypothetical protein